MRNHAEPRKLFRATVQVLALVIPVIAGVLTAPPLWPQSAASQSSATQSSSPQAPASQSLVSMEAAGVKMAFEVVSVKPDKTNGRAYSIVPLGPGTFPPTGGLFSATGYPLETYLGWAYDLKGYQYLRLLPRVPAWVTT